MSTDVLSLYYHDLFDAESNFLGKGAFGTVYRVFNKLDNRYYAVKRILITENNISSALKEIRILASVSHPNIVRYFNSWIESRPYDQVIEEMRQDDDDEEECSSGTIKDDAILRVRDTCYYFNIQMECCDMTLRSILSDRKAVDFSWNYNILCQVIEGMLFLHRNHIVHRDLKPDNILLIGDHVKIGDFGLAKIFSSPIPLESTTYVGSLLYAAPEQLRGEAYSFASDIYSLGVIMLEIQFCFITDMERVLVLNSTKKSRQVGKNLLYGDLIQTMLDPQAHGRPTITIVKNFFDPVLFHPAIICRDILWEIITALPIY